MKARRHWAVQRVLMRCDQCGYKVMRVQRGPCPKCKEGFLIHSAGQVKRLIAPAPIVVPGDD